MRLDGFSPVNPHSARISRQAPAIAAGADLAPRSTPPSVAAGPVDAHAGEYIPARQGQAAPVHGYANQAVASYQSTALLTEMDTGSSTAIAGIDLFV